MIEQHPLKYVPLSSMIRKNIKLHIIISTIVRILISIVLVTSLYNHNFLLIFSSSIMLFISFLPSILLKKYKIFLPSELEIILSLFLYASFILGEMRDYYLRYWWWDLMLHSFSAFMLGLIGFIIIYSFYITHRVTTSAALASIFSFSFALALGALWEIIEFSIDYLLHTNMQKSGLVDTMTDLMVNALGALIVSVLGFLYFKSGKLFIVDHFVDRFRKVTLRR